MSFNSASTVQKTPPKTKAFPPAALRPKVEAPKTKTNLNSPVFSPFVKKDRQRTLVKQTQGPQTNKETTTRPPALKPPQGIEPAGKQVADDDVAEKALIAALAGVTISSHPEPPVANPRSLQGKHEQSETDWQKTEKAAKRAEALEKHRDLYTAPEEEIRRAWATLALSEDEVRKGKEMKEQVRKEQVRKREAREEEVRKEEVRKEEARQGEGEGKGVGKEGTRKMEGGEEGE